MPINNLVIVSDTHCGCQLALCPPKIRLDNGGFYYASRLQKKLWKMYEIFLNEFIPKATREEDFILVHNGDLVDGVHHNSTTQISQNLSDQKIIAYEVMIKLLENPHCKGYYQIRGTEAHAGKSATIEEDAARELGAIPNEDGQHSRYDLWLKFGSRKLLAHFTHHIGVTNSASYESTAPYKELIEAYTEAGRWRLQPPDAVIRSHRHRHFKTEVASKNTNALSIITPAWQLKTPFAWRGGMGRSSTPQIGGIILREGEEVPIYERSKIWSVERSQEVIV